MSGFTKLFNSILHSTVWSEPNETRILWITMLAMANKNGEVMASIPGLARMAGISLDDTEKGLNRFMEPDTYSRTPDHEGRRIQKIEGGWFLLNHGKYRALMSAEERREYNRVKQAERRDRLSMTVNDKSMTISNVSTVQKQKQKQSTEAILPEEPTRRPSGFDEFWAAYPNRKGKGNAEKAWIKMHCASILPQILTCIRKAKSSPEWTKEGGQFIPHPATWLNRKGWEDEFGSNGVSTKKGEWLPSLPVDGPTITDEARQAGVEQLRALREGRG